MDNQIYEKIGEYKGLRRKIEKFEEASRLMIWDIKTSAPPKAIDGRAEVIATISAEAFKLSTSKEMESILCNLTKLESNYQLDYITKKSIELDYIKYVRQKSISPQKYQDYENLRIKAQAVWGKARIRKDFSLFKPYLERIVDYKKEMINAIGYHDHPYDILLDEYEPGMTVKKLDKLFNPLKESLGGLLEEIRASEFTSKDNLFTMEIDTLKQKKIILKLLKDMGFSMNKGIIGESMHPFALKINGGDTRIAINKLHPLTFQGALFSALHEGGHGLYEQNIGDMLENTPLFSGASKGIHEAQSRFWENMIGRSLAFWYYFIDEFKAELPDKFKGITPEELYQSVNRVNSTVFRTASDEISYNLHIILRYELEKQLISGELDIDELPSAWNEKIRKYIGITPRNDGEGVLQDIHWANGYFGYFPTYTLGNIYGAQLLDKLKRDLTDFETIIRRGDFLTITKWFVENVYTFGKLLSPEELIEGVTGEQVNARYFTNYLRSKFK